MVATSLMKSKRLIQDVVRRNKDTIPKNLEGVRDYLTEKENFNKAEE